MVTPASQTKLELNEDTIAALCRWCGGSSSSHMYQASVARVIDLADAGFVLGLLDELDTVTSNNTSRYGIPEHEDITFLSELVEAIEGSECS